MKIEGGDLIARRLAILPREVSGPSLHDAAMSGAKVLKKAVEQKAPRGRGDGYVWKGNKLGHLADNILAEVTAEKESRRVEISVGPDKDHWYGRLVENGHALVRVLGRYKKGRRTYRIKKVIGNVPPHPFMRPAFDENTAEAERAVAAVLKRRLGL